MKKDNKSIPVNLIQQNCFIRDVTRLSPNSYSSSPDTYLSLDEVATPTGIELRANVNDYPITPAYVRSFADSSDYRNDLASALSAKSSRPNLGDVSDIQKIASMDASQARALYNQLVSAFGSSLNNDVKSVNDASKEQKTEGGSVNV